MSAGGVAAVARHEFRLRIRAGRWRWLLTAWFVVTFGFAALLRLGLSQVSVEEAATRGAVMYGGLMLFVLALALLVVPALGAQSINGDRERGTLAVLQVTRLTPLEITLGKLVAAWGTALVFLALTAPVVVWAYVEGGVPLTRVAAVTLVMAALLGVVAAVALALSALLARTTTSSVLSYLAVFGLVVGTVVLFGLASALTVQTRTQTDRYFVCPGGGGGGPLAPGSAPPAGCDAQESSYTTTSPRTDRTWWLLAPNPFVILADAAPRPAPLPQRYADYGRVDSTGFDPLSAIGREIRSARAGPGGVTGGADGAEPAPIWPWGLVVDVALAVGAVALTVRRLRTPARTLSEGTRVA